MTFSVNNNNITAFRMLIARCALMQSISSPNRKAHTFNNINNVQTMRKRAGGNEKVASRRIAHKPTHTQTTFENLEIRSNK